MATYTLFGKKIKFQDAEERVFDLMHDSIQAAHCATDYFKKWYVGCGDILTVLKGYRKYAYDLVIKYANKPMFSTLTAIEIYDVSEDRYDENCLVLDEIDSAFSDIAEKYDDIVAEQELAEEYRAERKENRARVVGGGFGVGGALKGMAAAGAMNAVSGMGHSIANAIGNAASAAEAASSKKALYNSNDTYTTLARALHNDVINCYFAHKEFINKIKANYYVDNYDIDRGEALFESAKKVVEKQPELLSNSFSCYPWNEDLLNFIFVNHKSERKNVWDIAKRYHIDLRKIAEESFAKEYDSRVDDSEETAQRIKQDILSQMKELGIKHSSTIDRIEQDGVKRILDTYDSASDEERTKMFLLLEKYDATFSNKSKIVHDKKIWEIAKKYSVDFTRDEVEEILSKSYPKEARNSEEKAQIAKAKLKVIMTALNVKESTTFDALEKDCISRIVNGYQSATEEECNAIKKKITSYDALEKNKREFLQLIQSRIEEIWSKEDDEIFDNVYLNTDILQPSEIDKSIEFIKSKGRTSSADKYISALSTCNQENIKKAHIFQKPIAKWLLYFGLGVIALGLILLVLDCGILLSLAVAGIGAVFTVYYVNLKKNWNCLTLNGTLIHKTISLNNTETRHPSGDKK